MTTLWMFLDTPIGLAFAAAPVAFVAGGIAEAVLRLAARRQDRRSRADQPRTGAAAMAVAVEGTASS